MSKNKQIWDSGECLPDYNFWKRAAYWTIEEGVALTLDKEPRFFNTETLKDAPAEATIVSSYFEWLELAKRAVTKSKLSDQPIPQEFLEWRRITEIGEDEDIIVRFMREQDFGNPFSFIDYKESYLNLEIAYRAKCERNEELEIIETEYDQLIYLINTGQLVNNGATIGKKFDGRKKKSLQKILLAVAVIKFRFDPRDMKSSAPKNIESVISECGLVVTDETIRSHLREAVKCFPEIKSFFEGD